MSLVGIIYLLKMFANFQGFRQGQPVQSRHERLLHRVYILAYFPYVELSWCN